MELSPSGVKYTIRRAGPLTSNRMKSLLKHLNELNPGLDIVYSDSDEKGILPSDRKSNVWEAESSSIEKSIHSEFDRSIDRYGANYSCRVYTDVKLWKPGGWNLTGNGLSYETCGHIWYDEGMGCLKVQGHAFNDQTSGKIFIRLISVTCLRMSCPVCYQKACSKEAGLIEDRFMRVPRARGVTDPTAEAKTIWGLPIHVVVAVPEKDADLMNTDYKKLKRKALDSAKKAGIVGGCAIFHPFANDKLEADSQKNIKFDEHSQKFDIKALKEYYDKLDKSVGFWYWRPHFHLIGYGFIDTQAVSDNYKKTGWIVRNLGVRDSVIATAHYQLSHCGVKTGYHVVTWFGNMSYRTFKDFEPLPEPIRPAAKCPECGSPLVPIGYRAEGDLPLEGKAEGPYWIDPAGWVEIERLRPRLMQVGADNL